MAKVEPRETTGRPGPVRTSSGTRVAAVHRTPLTPSVASQPSANDISQMPTQELDLEQLRAMALRCASDVGAEEPALAAACDQAPMPVRDETSHPRPRLALVFTEEPDETPGTSHAATADLEEAEVERPRRLGRFVLALILIALAVAAVAAFDAYVVLP